MAAQPTYLVAVSGGSIYMGNSPNNLTLCTNGSGALVSGVPVGMVPGPPSINDADETARTQRHMYFCDGVRYRRLNAHTGEVRTWAAFNGTDAATGEPVYGVMPFGASAIAAITGESSGHPVVAGDRTEDFPNGAQVAIQGAEAPANGYYGVSSASYDVGTDTTTITLSVSPSLSGAGGFISAVSGVGTIMASWRERCLISGIVDDPYNIFASAVGDWLNWDYAPATTTETQAFALSQNRDGKVADIVTALVPFNDDICVIGGSRSIEALMGDPMAGGQRVSVSRDVGIVGNSAWAFGSGGELYFVARDGFYRMEPGAAGITKLSDGRLDRTFRSINYDTHRCLVVHDSPRARVYIFFTNDTPGQDNPPGYVYEVRVGALLPMALPPENGPTSVLFYDDPDDQTRCVLLGGRDGYVRSFRNTRANDNDGADAEGAGVDVAIESYVLLGPVAPAGTDIVWRMSEAALTLGSNSGPVDVLIYSAPTPELAARKAEPNIVVTKKVGDSRFIRRRLSGQSLAFEIRQDALNTVWCAEAFTVTGMTTGRARRPR